MDSKNLPVPLSDVGATSLWFQKAKPEPDSKDFHTQLGVHFEEIAEMLEVLVGPTYVTQVLISDLWQALDRLAKHLKASDNVLIVADRVKFLDSLCDQLVTSIGVAHTAHMDIQAGFSEVNKSNFSKFDDNGNPLLDINKKIMKGPNYQKPNLETFV